MTDRDLSHALLNLMFGVFGVWGRAGLLKCGWGIETCSRKLAPASSFGVSVGV
jgi:hypothetical protein